MMSLQRAFLLICIEGDLELWIKVTVNLLGSCKSDFRHFLSFLKHFQILRISRSLTILKFCGHSSCEKVTIRSPVHFLFLFS